MRINWNKREIQEQTKQSRNLSMKPSASSILLNLHHTFLFNPLCNTKAYLSMIVWNRSPKPHWSVQSSMLAIKLTLSLPLGAISIFSDRFWRIWRRKISVSRLWVKSQTNKGNTRVISFQTYATTRKTKKLETLAIRRKQ